MTKEELKQEAEKYVKRNYCEMCVMADDCKCGCIDCFTVQAYLAGAEPREKHIAELRKQLDLKEKALSKAKKETKRIADRVNKDKRRLIRRKAELEAQIEKMKCCGNCTKGNCVNIGQKGKACAYWTSNELRR